MNLESEAVGDGDGDTGGRLRCVSRQLSTKMCTNNRSYGRVAKYNVQGGTMLYNILDP